MSWLISARSELVENGLVTHYDPGNTSSYPGTGAVLTDLTGGNDATLTSAVTYSSNQGGILALNAGNIQPANMADYLKNVSAFTVSLFASFDRAQNNSGLFSFGNYTNFNNDIFALYTQNVISFQVNNGVDGGFAWRIPAASTFGHFTFVYNGAESLNINRAKFYLNGIQLQPLTPSYIYPATTSNLNNTASTIGNYSATNNSGWLLKNGIIGPFMVYNRAIDESENFKNFCFYRNRFSI